MFSKNIEALNLLNPDLAQKIQNISFEQAKETVSLVKNSNEDLILAKNNLPVDDINNPYDYSKKQVLENVKSKLQFNDFIVIFGLGLGYLTDVAFQNLPAKIILFEPDLNILRFVFETVDFTPYLNSKRVFISNSLNEFVILLSEKYLVNDKIEVLYLENYVVKNLELFNQLTNKLVETCQFKIMDINTIKNISKYWVRNILTNIQLCEYFYPVNVLEDKFKNKTALITAGGPSLKNILPFVRQNRDKFIIMAINRSLNSLMDNNIIPEFSVLMDAYNLITSFKPNKQFLSQINLITTLKADYYAYQIPSKRIFIEFSDDNDFSKQLKEKLPNEIKLYSPYSNATLMAYNLALKMGFKNIIFSGMDLAFRGSEVYADDIKVSLMDNKYHYTHSYKNVVEVKSVTGDLVKTRDDYALFVKQFEKILITKPEGVNIYNTTDFGALINGMIFKHISEIPDLKSNSSEFFEKTIKSIEFDPNKIKNVEKELLKKEMNNILKIQPKIIEWINTRQNFETFFQTAQEIISELSQTTILSIYIQYELLDYAKNILNKDNKGKKEMISELFNLSLTAIKFINNVITSI